MNSAIARDIRNAIQRRPRFFTLCLCATVVCAGLGALEAATGLFHSPLAPRPLSVARVDLAVQGQGHFLEAILAAGEGEPKLALFDANAATVTGGEKEAATLLSYCSNASGSIRLLCEGPGAATTLARVVEGARSSLAPGGSLVSLGTIGGFLYKSNLMRPLWILCLAFLGPLGFLSLSPVLDALDIAKARASKMRAKE